MDESEQLLFFDKWIQYHFYKLNEQDIEEEEEYNTCIPVFYPTDLLQGLQSGQGVGDFDFLDQDICRLAKNLGFNTIVFQHEIGSYDCVTEILHTGDYQNNIYRIDGIKTKTTNKTKYPKIWFPGQNGIVNEKGKLKITELDIIFDNEIEKERN